MLVVWGFRLLIPDYLKVSFPEFEEEWQDAVFREDGIHKMHTLSTFQPFVTEKIY